jgi:gamma-glutamylcyclotransferase
MPDDTQSEQTLYFGYGSNIWIEQMNSRCPDNKYIGVGVLREW